MNPTLIHDTIHVDDTNGGTWAFSASGSVSYDKTFSDADEGTNTNTATIRETGASKSASVTLNVYELEVTKDVTTTITRTYSWTIDKWASESILILGEGNSQPINYHVQVGASYIDTHAISGKIYVHNPAPIGARIIGITDVISPDIDATIVDLKVDNSPVSLPYILLSGKTLTVTYSADLPDDSGRTNTAKVTIRNHAQIYEGGGSSRT